ncbi:hypothetical protein [Streptomyces sp. NPDC060027]
MTHPARVTRVRHPGEVLDQSRDLLGPRFGLITELVKRGRDQG